MKKNASKSRVSRRTQLRNSKQRKSRSFKSVTRRRALRRYANESSASVERRIQESEAADRDLLKQLSDLHALDPAPPDLEALSAGIMAKRARLPDERAELVRARMGSTDAVRTAKEKLNTAESELAAVEKNMARTRSEFEARDQKLAESIRTQQQAARDARTRHQTVEERKNPAYLSIGRHLSEKGVAPPNAPHLLEEAHRRRGAVDLQLKHQAELAQLSSQIDKQELRKFYFSAFSVLVLLAITLLVVFQSPRGREWLPQATDTILSINADQFERANLAKRWRDEKPKLWPGLIGPAASVPGLNPSRDTARITRALTTDETGETKEFNLVQSRRGLAKVIRAVADDKNFRRRSDQRFARLGATVQLRRGYSRQAGFCPGPRRTGNARRWRARRSG